MFNHPSDPLVVTVEAVARVFEISRLDCVDDRLMITPCRHRICIFQIDEIGRLVEREPDHLDKPHQRLIFLTAEKQPVEKPVFVDK